MRILTVYAHPDPKSFCHAVLQQFTKGLKDAGHTNEVVDLYAIGFNPVLTNRDFANWLPDENAPDVVEKSYQERGLHEAMRRLIDDFCLHYPGIQTVEHAFFYAVNMADKDTLQGYLERAYRLGKDFSQDEYGGDL